MLGLVVADSLETQAGDCSSNSVVKCGVSSVGQLKQKYHGSTKNIFDGMGVGKHINTAPKVVNGYVTRSNTVTVDGKVVATNAVSAGRQYIHGGSIKRIHKGTKYYERAPSVSFRSSQLSAFVFLSKDGQFLGAVLKDCGNPVKGKNTVPKPPTPVYSCDELKVEAIAGKENNYRFTTRATAKNGASIVKYVYNFGGGTYTSSSSSVTHGYSKPGTYNVSVTPTFRVNGKNIPKTSDACKGTVTIKEKAAPGVSIEKTVNGKEHEKVEIGKPFNYEVTVANTGNVDLKDVAVSDKAPNGVTFKSADKGSIESNTWNYTIPTLAKGESASFKITAVMKDYQEGTIKNTACVETPTVPGGNPDDCDDATIETDEPTIKRCDIETGEIVTIKKSQASNPRYVDESECAPVERCDLETNEIVTISKHKAEEDKTRYVDKSQCEPVKRCDVNTGVIVTIPKHRAGASRYTEDLTQCEPVERCDTTTNTVVTIPRFQAGDAKYTTDLSQCEDVTRCDITTGKIVTIAKNEVDESKHVSADDDRCKVDVCEPESGEIIKVKRDDEDKYLPVDSKECQKDVRVCNPETKQIITVKESEAGNYEDEDSDSCKPVEPVEPKEEPKEEVKVESVATQLPQTGVTGTIGSILGLGSLTAATYYYLASRRM